MKLNHWQASGKPQRKSRKTPKSARRQRRKLAQFVQGLETRSPQ